MRYIEIGCVSALATLQKGVAPLYNEVTITRPTDVSAMRFCLRLADGKIIQQPSLTFDGLRQAGLEEIHRDWKVQYYDHKLKMHFDVSHEMGACGINCLFVGDTLVEIRLVTSVTNSVGIGREETGKFYALPLTQEDLERLFGRPDRIVDGHYW